MFFQLLEVCLSDVAVTWGCYIYDHFLLLLFIDHLDVWLISHHLFVSLDLEVPLDLGSVTILWGCFPS